MLFDKGGSNAVATEEEEAGGNENGVTIEADSEIGKAIHEQAGDAHPDGGTEAPEDEKGGGEDGSEIPGEEESGNESVKASPEEVIQSLRDEINDLKTKMGGIKPPEAPPQQPPRELTEEEWVDRENKLGVPRTAIDWFARSLIQANAQLKDHIENIINSRLGKFERNAVLEELAASDPEFADAKRYSKEIEEFLNKRVDPRFHSDPSFIKDAIIYSRGLNSKKTIQKVRSEKEINKKIAGPARPSSPTPPKGGKTLTITPEQHRAAKAAGWTDEEYMKAKVKVGRPIAE